MPVQSSSRTSPPTERVIQVLEYCSQRPDQQFGVSELARRLDLSKPTCLGIVSTLTSAGYLLREERTKTYRLGPALIALGQRAQEALKVSPQARDELRQLSSRFDTTAALSAVVGDRITLLELVAPLGVRTVEVGQSYPFAPPVGLMFVLWDDDAVRTWLAKEPTIPLRTRSERLDRVIAECRTDGYLVERLTPGGQRLYALLAGMSSDLPDELRALLGELVSDVGERVYLRGDTGGRERSDWGNNTGGRERSDWGNNTGRASPGTRHNISLISAPVFDHHRRQVMVASLHIGRELTDGEIREHADALVRVADRLTIQLGGTKAR